MLRGSRKSATGRCFHPTLRNAVRLSPQHQFFPLAGRDATSSRHFRSAWLRTCLTHSVTDELCKLKTAMRDVRRERSLEAAL